MTPSIRVESLSKSFGNHPILQDVSFTVQGGETFGLLGRSGTGKSVTLKLLIGLLPPDSGQITIGDDNVPQLDRSNLMRVRGMVGFLFQNGALFDSISLAENLAFPLRRRGTATEDIDRIVHETLAQVGLQEDGDKMPSDLSGGMQKRAGLARALVTDPPIILVDEPSSGLDRITAEEIYKLLEELKSRGKTLVIVTHDAQGIRRFVDHLCLLDKGHIVADGRPDELDHHPDQLVRDLVNGGVR